MFLGIDISFLGIDISKNNFDAVLLAAPDAKPRHKAFPNTEEGFARLHAWIDTTLAPGTPLHACLEATGTYGEALARFLHQQSDTVSVVNPARIHAFAKTHLARAKTDKADATLIARFCALHRPDPWTPTTDEQSELQAWTRRLETLTQMRQMEANRSESVLSDTVRTSVQEHLSYLDTEIQNAKQHIQDHIDTHPPLQEQRDLLVSIPGIGPATAAVLLAELGDFQQFDSARQVASFVGVVPRIVQSGSSVRGRGSLSKVGSPSLRKALYFPAMSALRCNPVLQALKSRLTVAGKNGKLIVVAAMRKLLHLAFGVLRSGRPFDPQFAAGQAQST